MLRMAERKDNAQTIIFSLNFCRKGKESLISKPWKLHILLVFHSFRRSIYLKKATPTQVTTLFRIARTHFMFIIVKLKKLNEPFKMSNFLFEFYVLMYYVTISNDVMDNFLWNSSPSPLLNYSIDQ